MKRFAVRSYLMRFGNGDRTAFTFSETLDSRTLTLEGHILAPDTSEFVLNTAKRPILRVPRPGINRFVTFHAEEALITAQRGNFGLQWEPESLENEKTHPKAN